jgi:hypothetical protein
VVVFPWCPELATSRNQDHGQASSPEHRQVFIAVAAPALQTLHQRGRPVARRCGDRQTSWPRHDRPWQLLTQADRIVALTLQKLRYLGASARVCDLVTRSRQQMEELARQEPAFFDPEQQVGRQTVLHGDLRPENTRIRGHELLRVFDFDFVRLGVPEEEVAYSALSLSGPSWFSGPRDWQVCAAFIDAYQTAALAKGNTGLEPAQLHAALRWTLLKELCLADLPELVEQRYALLEDLAQQAGQLTALVGAAP